MDITASPPPPVAALPVFSNRILRHMLSALRLVAGADYPAILRAGGLARYGQELPPATTDLTISGQEVAHLFRAAYMGLPAPQMLLFCTTLGEQIARVTAEGPGFPALAEQIQALPRQERVLAAWQGIHRLINGEVHLDRQTSSDDKNDYLIMADCPYCRDVRDAPRPICFIAVRYYEVLLHELTGRQVVVREVECAATDQRRCVFAVRREREDPILH